MTKVYLIKTIILFCLLIVLCSCNRNCFTIINIIEGFVVDTIAPSEQTEEERKERLLIFDAIDDYISKQEQIVLKTELNKVCTINTPDMVYWLN